MLQEVLLIYKSFSRQTYDIPLNDRIHVTSEHMFGFHPENFASNLYIDDTTSADIFLDESQRVSSAFHEQFNALSV